MYFRGIARNLQALPSGFFIWPFLFLLQLSISSQFYPELWLQMIWPGCWLGWCRLWPNRLWPTCIDRLWPKLRWPTLAKPTVSLLAFFFKKKREQQDEKKKKHRRTTPFGAPKGEARKGGGAQIFALFFPSPATILFFFLSLWGSFSWSMHIWGSRLSKTPPKFLENTPKRRKKEWKIVAGEGKKSAKFWAVRERSGPAGRRSRGRRSWGGRSWGGFKEKKDKKKKTIKWSKIQKKKK